MTDASWADIYAGFQIATADEPANWKFISQFISEPFPAEAIDLIVSFMSKAPTPECNYFTNAFGGAVAGSEPSGGSAFAHRDALFYAEPGAGWGGARGGAMPAGSADPLTPVCLDWIAEFAEALAPYVNGAYVNVPNAGMADWETAYWGPERRPTARDQGEVRPRQRVQLRAEHCTENLTSGQHPDSLAQRFGDVPISILAGDITHLTTGSRRKPRELARRLRRIRPRLGFPCVGRNRLTVSCVHLNPPATLDHRRPTSTERSSGDGVVEPQSQASGGGHRPCGRWSSCATRHGDGSAAARLLRSGWLGVWSAAPRTPPAAATARPVRPVNEPEVGHPQWDRAGDLDAHVRRQTARVRLSNRFGTVPATFAQASIARRDSEPAVVPGTTAPLTFGGLPEVTVAPGDDVLSDPVEISFQEFDPLAVSIYVAGDIGYPTEHYVADRPPI